MSKNHNHNQTEKATFGMGCFWEPQELFENTEGVISTTVGYAGGTKDAPTYKSLGDHTEVVQISYDPKTISYEKLLELFWENHNAIQPQKTQYRSLILTHSKDQQGLAQESKSRQIDSDRINTEIEPIKQFYKAEKYHQHYLKKTA